MPFVDEARVATLPATAESDLQIARSVGIAIWLAFVGNVCRGVLHNNELLRHLICRPLVDAGGAILIAQGIRAFVAGKRSSESRTIHLVASLTLGIALFAMVHGLVSGANLMVWFRMGLMGFGTGFAVFLATRPFVFEYAFRAMRRQVIVADLFVAYVLLHWTSASRFSWFWTDQANEGLGAIANRCFFALPFLIAMHRRLSAWELFFVGAGFIEYLILNVEGENRSAVVIALVVIPVSLIAIALRQGQGLRWMWKAALCSSIVGLLLVQGMMSTDSFDRVMQRFGVADVSTATPSQIASHMELTAWDNFVGNGNRAEEMRELIYDTSVPQFVFGRGFGVSWYAPLWATMSPKWYMVHFGPGEMLLVGGIPLAICFTALIGLSIWKAWSNVGRVPAAAGALMFLSAAAVNYLQHGVLLDEAEFYLLWLCIGFSVGVPRSITGTRRNAATTQH